MLGTVVEVNHIIIYLLIVGLSILLCLQLMSKLEDTLVIISSVVLGSVLAVRGLGVMTNTFPDEIYLINLLKNGETTQFSNEMKQVVVLNFVAIALFIIVGLMLQYSMLKQREEEKVEGKEGDKEGEDKEKCGADIKDNKEVAGDAKTQNVVDQ